VNEPNHLRRIVIAAIILSLIATPPPQLIRIAARAGFDLVDLRLSPATPTDTIYATEERLALCRQLFPLLRDLDLKVWDVEIIRLKDETDPHDHLPLMEAVVEASPFPVYASGGVTSMQDLRALEHRGLAAAVIGMALYTGALDPVVVAGEFGE